MRSVDPVVRFASAVAALALLAAGCGGGSKATAPQRNRALAFSACMRSNGVATYPDPGGSGRLVKESLRQLGVSGARFRSAESACRRFLPDGGRDPSPAQVQAVAALSLRFAQCVRAHGVPGFPDPDATGRIPDPATVGIDQGSPTFRAANDVCAKYRPPYLPSNAAYAAWARAHPAGS